MNKIAVTGILGLILTFGMAISTPCQNKVAPANKQEKFDPNRDSEKDLKFGIEIAKKQNKMILLDVGGEWCPWCHKLDKTFKEDKEIAKILAEKYVVIKINYSQENKNEKVLSKYPEIKGFPHLFVLNNQGKLVHSQDTGELETGDHHDHDKVMTFLKKWGN